MNIRSFKVKAKASVWSFDCYTQHATVEMPDGTEFEIEITDKEGFLSREEEYGGEIEYDMTPKSVPVEIEIPFNLHIPKRIV